MRLMPIGKGSKSTMHNNTNAKVSPRKYGGHPGGSFATPSHAFMDASGGIRLNELIRNPAGEYLIEKLCVIETTPEEIQQAPVKPPDVYRLKHLMTLLDVKEYSSQYSMCHLSENGEPVARRTISGGEITSAFSTTKKCKRGTMMIVEEPLLTCPRSIGGAIESFLNLSKHIVDIVMGPEAPAVNSSLLSQEDRLGVLGGLEVLSERLSMKQEVKTELGDALIWWYALLQSFGWSHPDHEDTWVLYRVALHLPVSCVPNCIIRKHPGGTCSIVASSNLNSGDILYVSPTDVTLYASTPHRRMELMQANSLLCRCERCRMPVDAARRIWCRSCRRSIESSANMTNSAPFAVAVHQGLVCPNCNTTHGEDAYPKAMETVLEGVFSKLQSSFDTMAEQEWLGHVAYLQTTAADTLSPHHWILMGTHHILARFYLWRATAVGSRKEKKRISDLAYWHGIEFLKILEGRIAEESQLIAEHIGTHRKADAMFVQISAPLILELMILSLDGGEFGSFVSLVEQFLPTVLLQYGYDHLPVQDLIIPSIFKLIEFFDQAGMKKLKRTAFKDDVARYHIEQSTRNTAVTNPDDIDDELHMAHLSKTLKSYKGLRTLWGKSSPWRSNVSKTPIVKGTITPMAPNQQCKNIPTQKKRQFIACSGN